MKTVVVISCLLSTGQPLSLRGSYKDWKQCNSNVARFEQRMKKDKEAVCWCHRKNYTYHYPALPPLPVRRDPSITNGRTSEDSD